MKDKDIKDTMVSAKKFEPKDDDKSKDKGRDKHEEVPQPSGTNETTEGQPS